MTEFLRYRLYRRNQELHDDVVCRACYEAAPDMQPLTEREKAVGMRQRIEVIAATVPATCQECGAEREGETCAMCDRPRHPADSTLCMTHLAAIGMALSRALWSFRDSARDEAQVSPSRLAVGRRGANGADSPQYPVPPDIQAGYESAVRQRQDLRRLD